jgi:hypothetical protein
VALGSAAALAIERAMRAYLAWQVGHVLRRGGDADGRVEPEGRFVVHLGDTGVVCDRPDGTSERISWDGLQRVEIVSTSEGPTVPDIFWLLVGETDGCAIPWGATGEHELLLRLQALPGFDNDAVIAAATDATESRRTCWQRVPA